MTKKITSNDVSLIDKMLKDIQESNDFKNMFMFRCSHCFKKYTSTEMIALPSFWINPKKKKYGKGTVCHCGMKLHEEKWHILSKVDNILISTVDLLIPHGGMFMSQWMDHAYWYETMFFTVQPGEDDKFNSFQMRYKTQEEAVKGHKFTLDNINLILENPDKYPKGIINTMCEGFAQASYEKDKLSEETKKRST